MSDSLWPQELACQSPLSTWLFRQEYWSVLPFPSPRDLPDLGIESMSSALAGRFLTTEPSQKPCSYIYICVYTYIYIYVCAVLCIVAQSCPTICYSYMNCNLPGFSVHGDSLSNNTGVGCHALLQGSSQLRDWTPALQVDSLPAELPVAWNTLPNLSQPTFLIWKKSMVMLMAQSCSCES